MRKHGLLYPAAIFAASAGFFLASHTALASSSVYVSNLALSNGYEQVSMDVNGSTMSGIYAGQMDLTTNFGASFSNPTFDVYAWCVDFYHDINIGADSDIYTLSSMSTINTDPDTPGGQLITSAQAAKMTWLASYGDNYLAAHGPDGEMSAAVQVAIWNAEYGYTYNGSDSALSSDLANLESLYNTNRNAYPANARTAAFVSPGSLTQGLTGVVTAPEGGPTAGYLLVSCGLIGLAAFSRRRVAALSRM